MDCKVRSTESMKSKKNPAFAGLRGPERIRTAVGAFAELCLATRPQDPVGDSENKQYF